MGVEVAESTLPVTVENGSESKMPVGNIKFGSHDGNEPAKVEMNKVSESNLRKNAVDDWPEPTQIHSFYVVKYRAIEDQNLRAKLDMAEKDLQKKNQTRVQLVEKLKAKRAERAQVIAQFKALSVESRQFRTIMDEKRKEMEPLQQALGKLRGGRDRGSGLCSSEEELNKAIKSLQYRIQHESIPLSEEKQILREIKQLEGTREKVVANAAERAKIQDSLGEKDTIQDQVKLIGAGLDGARKEKQGLAAKLKQLDDEKLAVDKVIEAIEKELTALTEKRDTAFDEIREMRKQREEGNSSFYENRALLTKAKVLAAKKDIAAVKEVADTEVEKFLHLWNSNKAFRDDYEKRIFSSLDMRQFSRDGRMRDPSEKPLVPVEKPSSSQPEAVKIITKQPSKENKGDAVAASEQKVQKPKVAKNNKESNKKKETIVEKIDQEDTLEVVPMVEVLPKWVEVDVAKLKELKREEEKAKRIQAEERKKKLAEKAAAKAEIKAQKEAEKKLKEREKRARKKSGATAVEAEEPTEPVAEVAEPEKIEEAIEPSAPQKNKVDRKENAVRHRGGRARGPDALPKAILKRKKATNYWMWGAPVALVVLLLAFAVGYNYLS